MARHDSKSTLRVLPYVLDGGRGQGQKHALPVVPEQGGKGEAEGYTESGAEEAKGGEEMTKGEYQRYQRLVIRYFPDYLIYQLYRRPRKCKMRRVIKTYKGARK